MAADDPALSSTPSSSPSEPPEADVLDAALRLLSTRARSVRELEKRLLKKGFETGRVSQCLRWLEDRNLLDDQAFARSMLRHRVRFSPRGPFVLRRELEEKGIDPTLAAQVVDAFFDEEDHTPSSLSSEAAVGWVRRQKSGTRKALLGDRFSHERERARKRLYGFLARRGFVGDAARLGLEAGVAEAQRMESGEAGEP